MAVKKGVLDSFLKPNPIYKHNQESFRSIFLGEESTALENQNIESTKNTQLDQKETGENNIIDHRIDKQNGKNREQIRNKPGTNREQTGNKPGTKLETNQEQTGNKNLKVKETGNKPGTESGTELGTNWEQTGNKQGTNCSFSTLIGLQRTCLIFVYKSCKITRSKITEPLSLEHFSEYVKTTKDTVKTTLKRLVNKKCLMRVEFKIGRGGWSTYELPENIFTEMLRYETGNKLGTNWEQTGNKPGTQSGTQSGTTPLSSSSYINNLNINKTTTTAEGEKNFLPDEWLKIDTSPLEHIFFSTTQLRQLIDKNIPEVVQESINFFSYEISQEPEKYKKPLNVLMGVLRQGNSWAAPQGYEVPKDKALREYAERKKFELEKRNQLVNDLVNLEFSDWQAALNQDEIKNIVPEEIRNSRLTAAKTSVLKNYFQDQILIPRLKTEGIL